MSLCAFDLSSKSDSFRMARDGSERFRPIFHVFQINFFKKSGSITAFGIRLGVSFVLWKLVTGDGETLIGSLQAP